MNLAFRDNKEKILLEVFIDSHDEDQLSRAVLECIKKHKEIVDVVQWDLEDGPFFLIDLRDAVKILYGPQTFQP